jgi:hypothetical protein
VAKHGRHQGRAANIEQNDLMEWDTKPQSEQGYVSVDDDIALNEGNKPVPIDLHLPQEIGNTQADECRATNRREEASPSEVANMFDDATLTLAVLLADNSQASAG